MHDTRGVTDAADLPAHSCNAQDSIPRRKVNCTGVFLKYIPWNPMVPRGELAQEKFLGPLNCAMWRCPELSQSPVSPHASYI
jgi:hypothetical protein